MNATECPTATIPAMSTIAHPTREPRLHQLREAFLTAPEDAFRELLFEHPDICSHCYARLGYSGRPATERKSINAIATTYMERAQAGSLESFSWGRRLYQATCGECQFHRGFDRELEAEHHAEDHTDKTGHYTEVEISEQPGPETIAPRTVCTDCGQRRATDSEVLSTRQMMFFAENVIDRLSELGIDADLDVLRDFIGEVKSRSEAQGYETEMFARGTRLAIRHADS